MGTWGKFDGKRLDDERHSSRRSNHRRNSDFEPDMDFNEDIQENYDNSYQEQDELVIKIENYLDAFDNKDIRITQSQTVDFIKASKIWLDQMDNKQRFSTDDCLLAGRIFLVLTTLNCIDKNVLLQARYTDEQLFARAALGFLLIALINGASKVEIQNHIDHLSELFQSKNDFIIFSEEITDKFLKLIKEDPDFIQHFTTSMSHIF